MMNVFPPVLNATKTDPRFDILTEFMVKVDGKDLCARLMEAGVPAGPVLDTAQVMNADHTKHRDMAAVCDCGKEPVHQSSSREPGGY